MNMLLSIAFSFHPNIAVHLVLLTIARKEPIFHPLCVLCFASVPRFSEKIRLLMHQETVPQIQGRSDSERASSRGSAWSTRDGKIAHGQVDDLVHGLIRGKDAMITRHLAQRHSDGFNGIGGVDLRACVFCKDK